MVNNFDVYFSVFEALIDSMQTVKKHHHHHHRHHVNHVKHDKMLERFNATLLQENYYHRYLYTSSNHFILFCMNLSK